MGDEVLPTGGLGPEADRLLRARQVFLDVRELPLALREEAIDEACAGDGELRVVVLMLLRGERAPLPIEAIADELRAVAEAHADAGAEPTWTGTGDVGGTGVSGGEAASVHGTAPTGGRIGHYRLLERLGEGGFGVVFVAEQERPVRRLVALKIIKLGMDTKLVVARFEAERQALALMDHPNIAKVFDAGATESGRPYFVMELVRGLPITEYCDRRALGIRERVALIAQVCEALQHAHQRGVIHRDIKPSNVIVGTIEGDKALPKIIDFGIAKATSARLTERTIFTELRQMVGTPEYMSPEQAGDSAEDVDTRVDVYAAGALLYELLTGSPPFDAGRLRSAAYGEMQRIIREEDPPRPSTRVATSHETLSSVAKHRSMVDTRVAGAIKGELDWIVMKAIEKDRARRYDSAGSMATDLERYLSGHAVHAAPPGRAYLFRKLVRRHKGPVIAGSLLLCALCVGLIGTSLGFLNAEWRRREVVKEKDRADENAAEARNAEALARRSAYSANMLSASSAMSAGQIARTREFLEAAPPALRGWEWSVLHSRLDTSQRVLPTPMVAQFESTDYMKAFDLIFHPDGQSIFTVQPWAPQVAQRWDLRTGQRLATFARSDPERPSPRQVRAGLHAAVLLAPDGARLYTLNASLDSAEFEVSTWDLGATSVAAGSPVGTIRRSPGDVDGQVAWRAALSPEGERLLRNRGLRFWLEEVATGRELAAGEGIHANSSLWWFNADGSLLAASDGRGGLRVFDGRTLAPLATLVGHRNAVQQVEVSADRRWLASAALDGTARIWDLRSPPPQSCVVLEHSSAVRDVAFSPDATLVATSAMDRVICVWNAQSGELRALFSTGDLIRGCVAFMPDGHTVVGRQIDGTIRFWDVDAEATVSLAGHQGMVDHVGFAPSAGLIVTKGWDGWRGAPGSVKFWDAETGEPVAARGAPGEVVYRVTVAPSGDLVGLLIRVVDSPWSDASRVGHERIEIVDLTTGNVRTIDRGRHEGGSDEHGWSLAFDPKGKRLAISSHAHLQILDARTSEVLARRDFPKGTSLDCFALWSPDGRTLVGNAIQTNGAASADGAANWTILMLDPATLKTVLEIAAEPCYCVDFTPDSKHLCTGATDGVLRTYDLETGSLMSRLAVNDVGIRPIAFSPDGTRLATVGREGGDVVVWNTTVSPYDRVARFHQDGYASAAAWDATGTRLATAHDKTVRIWDATPLRERVAAREARRQAMTRVAPMVVALVAELNDRTAVAERVKADPELDELERRTALQVLLRLGLEADVAQKPAEERVTG